MVFSAIQVLAMIFALFAWSRAFMRFKDHQINGSSFLLWSLVWASLLLAALLPNTPSIIATTIGVQRPVDVLVYGSIIVLLYAVFRLYIKIEDNNFELTRLVRAIAIENPKKRR